MPGNRLKQLRKAKRLRQKDVAEQLGITREAYNQYENNRRQPSASVLVQLAAYFQVSIDFLADRTDYPESVPVIASDEIQLLTQYRCIDARGQALIRSFADYEAQRSGKLE